MTAQSDTQTLVESFCTLADEVQNLIDRKTILEHKLRFAAEQYQQLADKYAPTAPEIADTLAHLQVPPDDHKPSISSSYVPLPKRGQAGCNQHQIALLIRDGRRAAQQLSVRTDASGGSSKETSSGTAITTMSTMMEQDFTVEGTKGVLGCPFSAMKRQQQLQGQQQQLEQENQQLRINGALSQTDDVDDHDGADTAAVVAAAAEGTEGANGADGVDGVDPTPHQSTDPICVAMFEESTSQPAPSSGGAARCPIRFLDQHSPEEVAHYVETHKHQLPRSHAICLKRYNKNEEQIRKIDAKYGNLVNMISGLGHFHQPMLASAETGGPGGAEAEADAEEVVDRAALHRDSHERVKTWANGVSASGGGSGPDHYDGDDDEEADSRGRRSLSSSSPVNSRNSRRESSGSGDAVVLDGDNTDLERESHFDRPLKEVRLGESPSRPWGIAVPISSLPHTETQPPLSPPAAPVRMPSPVRARAPCIPDSVTKAPVRKCPFDHTKFGLGVSLPPGHEQIPSHDQETTLAVRGTEEGEDEDENDKASAQPMAAPTERPFTPMKPQAKAMPQLPHVPPQLSQTTQIPSSAGGPPPLPQPAFVNLPQAIPAAASPPKQGGAAVPQMVFTGPVFIGYPIEQAMQFMQHFQNLQRQ